MPRLTKYIRDLTYINTLNLERLIGLILGDAYFKKGNGVNVRIGFKQSIINFPFFWLVYTQLSHYCSTLPRLEMTKLNNNKKYGLLTLETRYYPVLNLLYVLFIIDNRKGIRSELFHYISPVSLAYWIMSDGKSNQYGLTLCTESFTLKENIILMNILMIKFNLNCNIHYANKKPRIYIKANSMNKLRLIVAPHMIPFSNYKLQKGRRKDYIY